MTKELIVIEEKKVLVAFNDDGIDPYIKQAKELVANFDYDLSTGASRAKIASLASKVSKFKVKLDGVGKGLVAEWKSKSTLVDKSRKNMRDELDDLRDLARKPLTDWEAEQEKIKAEKLAKEEADKKQAQVDADHELAIEQYKTHIREVSDKKIADELAEKELARQQEIERINREDKIKREATAKAKIIAEKAAEESKTKAKEAEQEAIRDKLKAEHELIDAKSRERLLTEQATQRKLDQEWFDYISEAYEINDALIAKAETKRIAGIAEANRLQAIESERLAGIQRQNDIQAKIDADTKAREADTKYKASVHRGIINAFIGAGFSEDDSIKIMKVLVKNKAPKVIVNY